MTPIQIVTDSAVALTPEAMATYDINIVPLSVRVDGSVYEDGITIGRNQFLDMMSTSKTLPQTSQPPLGNFMAIYEDVHQRHPESEILSLHISSGMSGTIHAAEQAAALAGLPVTAFDTLSADQGQGFMVLEAARMAQAGHDMATIVARLEYMRERTRVMLSFTSLNNMVAGGRLTRAQGIIGSLLNIKVGATMVADGTVSLLMKGRGMKALSKYHNGVIQEMCAKEKMHAIGVSHAGVPEVAQKMADRLSELFPDVPIAVLTTAPIIATHTGIGAMAIMYYAE